MDTIKSAVQHFGHGGLLSKLSLSYQMGNLRRFYREDVAPDGWSFESFTNFMLDFVNFRRRFADNEDRVWSGRPPRHRPLLIASMHFQDAYNYQVDRVNQCLVHYAAPDGRLYPFCSYNSGPCHRTRVEQQFAVPTKEYQAAHQAQTTV